MWNFTTLGGRVRKIAVEKGRPSTSQMITGVPPVTFCAGSSESDHSGVLPVKVRWSVDCDRNRQQPGAGAPGVTCAGTRPALFPPLFFAPSHHLQGNAETVSTIKREISNIIIIIKHVFPLKTSHFPNLTL